MTYHQRGTTHIDEVLQTTVTKPEKSMVWRGTTEHGITTTLSGKEALKKREDWWAKLREAQNENAVLTGRGKGTNLDTLLKGRRPQR